jgi:hypothetical protein
VGSGSYSWEAKTWLSSSGIDLQKIQWTELCTIFLERFPDSNQIDPMDQLQHLRQLTTVDSYINAYETWMTLMKRDRSYLPTDFFVDRFLSGLKDNIKHNVQCQKPSMLLSSYWYARQYEKSVNSSARRPPTAPLQNRGFPARENRLRAANP